jgi:hypothetical protein
MRSKLLNGSAAIALLTAWWSCGETQPTIAITQLSAYGFGGTGQALLAAPSLVDLLGLVYGMGSRPGLDECQRFQDLRATCWLDVKDPGNSLILAGVVDEPSCRAASITATSSGTNEVTITVDNGWGCALGGGGASSSSHLSLLAIPLTALPVDEITLKLVHTGLAVPMAKMMVDLRRPLNTHQDVQTVINEVRAASSAVVNDAFSRVAPGQGFSLLAIGTNRWTDTGLGCPRPGQPFTPADARGYVVFLTEYHPNSAMEYRVSGANVAFCGRVAY